MFILAFFSRVPILELQQQLGTYECVCVRITSTTIVVKYPIFIACLNINAF